MSLLLHQIRQGHGQRISGILPDFPCPIGTALMVVFDPVRQQNKFELANKRADGFLCQNLLGRQAYDSAMANGLGCPYCVGGCGCIEGASLLECEGSDYINRDPTTNGHLSPVTKPGTPLSFRNGKFTVAEDTERSQFYLLGVMTPENKGNLRICVAART
jgi:hypothetical protein